MPTLDETFGFVMALAVCVALFWVAMAICRALLGNFGTALLITVVAVTAAVQGWQHLIHSDRLVLQMIGWGVVGPSIWLVLKGTQVGVRKVRTWWAEAPGDSGNTPASSAAAEVEEEPESPGSDWVFEPAEPDVGFLSDTVTHVCQANLDDPDGAQPATLAGSHQFPTPGVDGLVNDETTFECPACHATTTTVEQWPASYFEEQDWTDLR